MEEYFLVKLLAAIWKNMKTSIEECYFCKVAGYGCFSRFLNCTNGTKSHNASQLYKVALVISLIIFLLLNQFNPSMPGGSKSSFELKQTCN